jgi:hypothetical protein
MDPEKHSYEKVGSLNQITVFKSFGKEERKRNIDCRYYLECLDDAARKNVMNLGCKNCYYKDDASYTINETDYHRLLKLFYTIKTPRFLN